MKSTYIIVKYQFPGFHWYEDAPNEVAFLKHRHRHIFKVEATLEVFHNDRELEFFMVQSTIEREIVPFVAMRDNLGSCENIADYILGGLQNAYGTHRYINVQVSEDGENAGEIEYVPE